MHIGPEIIPRKYDLSNLVKAEKGKIGGFVLKNHFYPTQPFVNEIKDSKGLKLFGSIALNNSIGGLNSEAIYASYMLSNKPLVVWFPTINAENFLRQNRYEIPPEWVSKKDFVTRAAKKIEAVNVTMNNKLTKESLTILRVIKETNSILATGHISWKESILLANKALGIGVRKIVITHPIYQSIAMPIRVQKLLAEKGCFIEQSYSMFSIDEIPIRKIANQIRFVGFKSIILSSDVGQTFSPSPSNALFDFANKLKREGFTENELFTMLVTNPKKLLSID